MNVFRLLAILLCCGCSASHLLKKEIAKQLHARSFDQPVNIDSLITSLQPLSSRAREKVLVPLMLGGSIPSYELHLKKIHIQYIDSNKRKYEVILFVSPDYLSVGCNGHFMRMPLTPQSAQRIADSLHCILPTKKIVDAIYLNARIKLTPQPLVAKRDSLITFLQHDSIIQRQLLYRYPHKIIAGIKKDVVQTTKIYSSEKSNRVAIYGWHQTDRKAIQPLYTGHVDWYVDYSHGIRLVYEKLVLNGKIFLLKDILDDPQLQKIFCDEALCGYTRYKTSE